MRQVGAGVAAAGALVLTACTTAAEEPPGVVTTPIATPTPTPTPDSETQDLSDPGLGIAFDEAPVLTGEEAEVYNLVATYQLEYWRTMSTNTVSPGLAVIASTDIQAIMADVAVSNAADLVDIGGTFRTRVADVTIDGDSATATACDDYRESTFADQDGPDTPQSAGFADPRLKLVTLQRVPDGRWIVATTERTGTC